MLLKKSGLSAMVLFKLFVIILVLNSLVLLQSTELQKRTITEYKNIALRKKCINLSYRFNALAQRNQDRTIAER